MKDIERKNTYILSRLKLSKNMQFGANADIYMTNK